MLAAFALALFCLRPVLSQYDDEYLEGFGGDAYGDYPEDPITFAIESNIGRVRRYTTENTFGTLNSREIDDVKEALKQILFGRQIDDFFVSGQITTTAPMKPNLDSLDSNSIPPVYQFEAEDTDATQVLSPEESLFATNSLEILFFTPRRSTNVAIKKPTNTVRKSTESIKLLTHEPKRSTTKHGQSGKHGLERSRIHGPNRSTLHRPTRLTTHLPTRSTTHRPTRSTPHGPTRSTTNRPTRSTTHGPMRSTTHGPMRSTTHGPMRSLTHRPTRSTTRGPTRSTIRRMRPTELIPWRSTIHGPDRSIWRMFRRPTIQTPNRTIGQLKWPAKANTESYEWGFLTVQPDSITFQSDLNNFEGNTEQQDSARRNQDYNIHKPLRSNSTTSPLNVTTTSSTTTTITMTTTTMTLPRFDIEKFLEIIANLTYDYETNLTMQVNETLIRMSVPTCPTPTTTTTVETTTTPPLDYSGLNRTLMAKCFVCGLTTPGIPSDADCADAFAGDFLPLVPQDPRAKGKIARFRKYCRYGDVYNYFQNASQPRTMYGRWTGGCSVRWTDVTGIYTQRSCRNKRRPTTGLHYASKRMAKLELTLSHIDDGCVVSPVASLLPLSRGISLYARFHACVCTGSWCNCAEQTVSLFNVGTAMLAIWLAIS